MTDKQVIAILMAYLDVNTVAVPGKSMEKLSEIAFNYLDAADAVLSKYKRGSNRGEKHPERAYQ